MTHVIIGGLHSADISIQAVPILHNQGPKVGSGSSGLLAKQLSTHYG